MPNQPAVIVIGPDPKPVPAWCEDGQMSCWEQPLGQPEGTPLRPCRWCQAARG